MLYKQKFFSFLLPKIVSGHKAAAAGADQAVYLIALSCLLQHIPRQMSLTELPKVRFLLAAFDCLLADNTLSQLMPLLITALDLSDSALRANVIETLGVLAKEVPSEMQLAISGIVTKVLKGLSVGSSTKGSVVSLSTLSLPDHVLMLDHDARNSDWPRSTFWPSYQRTLDM